MNSSASGFGAFGGAARSTGPFAKDSVFETPTKDEEGAAKAEVRKTASIEGERLTPSGREAADEVEGEEADEVEGEEADEVEGEEADEVEGEEADEVGGEEADEVGGEEADEVEGEEVSEVEGEQALDDEEEKHVTKFAEDEETCKDDEKDASTPTHDRLPSVGVDDSVETGREGDDNSR
ncbi:hypothetical protein FOZ62_014126, partial [Perkinsus olseni]